VARHASPRLIIHRKREKQRRALGGGHPGAALHTGLERWGNAKPELILRGARQRDVRWQQLIEPFDCCLGSQTVKRNRVPNWPLVDQGGSEIVATFDVRQQALHRWDDRSSCGRVRGRVGARTKPE
jgi:hypothetical protein